VLDDALSQIGKEVGSGECTDLAELVLQQAGAKTTQSYGVTGLTADYVWGQKVASLTPGHVNTSAIRAGDILQFSNVTTTTGSSTLTADHHTAVVAAVLPNGQLEVLEQNVNGQLTVREDVYNFSTMSSGTVSVYQPVQA
jgi:hypothetical protein